MNIIWTKTFHKGEKWSGVIRRGRLVRLTALGADANLSALFYNAQDHSERYNMPDTLKAQHTFHLTTGNILMTDNGRAMISIVEDRLGWHDTVSGYTTRALTDGKYGESLYQKVRNEWLRCGQENFTIELMRNGMDARDLTAPVNFFSKVTSDDQGKMTFVKDYCPFEATVTLRTEMDTLFILSNTPNPLDPAENYPSVPIRVEVLPAAPVTPLDPCVLSCPENQRAFENTWDMYALAQ